MTKADLIAALMEKFPDQAQAEAAKMVEEVLGAIKGALAEGEEVKITGFGTFETRSKLERQGRNPQTGEPLTIEARRVVRFKPSELLRARMNGRKG